MTMTDICRYTGKKILRPSLKLIGAKTKIRDLLYLHFPPHQVYFEPFLGTGGVTVGKERAKFEHVSDLNDYLINYYQVIQHRPLEFWDSMIHEWAELTYYGDPLLHKFCFERWTARVTETKDDLERAVLFYLVTKHCFNGIWRINQDGKCNSSWGGETEGRGIFDKYWLLQVHKRIHGVQFSHRKYQLSLLDAEVTGRKSDTFVFLDPPYHDCATTYNGEFFDDGDFRTMAEALEDSSYKWLLTINDDPFIRDLFKGYSMIPHSVFYSCNVKGSERKKQPELIIANYPLDPVPPNMQLQLSFS